MKNTLVRLGAAVAISVAAAASLVGCGGDDTPSSSADSGYCSDVQDAKDSFEALLNNQIDQQAFENLGVQLKAIAGEAPAAIKAKWLTVSKAVDDFRSALDDAGLTMEDMHDMGSGPMSGGAPMERAMNAAAALGAASFSTAQSAVARNVQSECHFSLS